MSFFIRFINWFINDRSLINLVKKINFLVNLLNLLEFSIFIKDRSLINLQKRMVLTIYKARFGFTMKPYILIKNT